MMDAIILPKGGDFDSLSETYVIFITEHDVIGRGRPLYYVERCFMDTGERFEDGSHILYVNGAYRDETPIGKLMKDFSCTDPADMNYSILADRVKFFKESKEGMAIMCKVMEDMRTQSLQEGIQEGMKTAALRMLEAGRYALDEIMAVSGLSQDEVEKLKAGENI